MPEIPARTILRGGDFSRLNCRGNRGRRFLHRTPQRPIDALGKPAGRQVVLIEDACRASALGFRSQFFSELVSDQYNGGHGRIPPQCPQPIDAAVTRNVETLLQHDEVESFPVEGLVRTPSGPPVAHDLQVRPEPPGAKSQKVPNSPLGSITNALLSAACIAIPPCINRAGRLARAQMAAGGRASSAANSLTAPRRTGLTRQLSKPASMPITRSADDELPVSITTVAPCCSGCFLMRPQIS